VTEKEHTFDALNITSNDVYMQMGYLDGTVDKAVASETETIVSDVRRWLRPRFVYLTQSDIPSGFHLGKIITHQLHGSTAYAFFIATAGREYEDYLLQLKQQGDEVRVFIADALGSVIAEHCADAMERQLQASIDKLSWHHTNRFSPGYCGWPVSEQQVLFPLFGGHTCGVSLTEGSLMVPIKSVSGIIGMGAKTTRKEYACNLCDYDKCYKRKHKR
jgi:hypothetical protein